MMIKIPFDLIELEKDNYLITIQISIAEVKTTWIVDTGASKTVIDSNQEQYLSILSHQPEDIEYTGVGSSSMNIQLATISDFRVGPLHIDKQEAASVDLSHVNVAFQKFNEITITGLLGSDFLMDHGAVINYRTNIIELEEK